MNQPRAAVKLPIHIREMLGLNLCRYTGKKTEDFRGFPHPSRKIPAMVPRFGHVASKSIPIHHSLVIRRSTVKLLTVSQNKPRQEIFQCVNA